MRSDTIRWFTVAKSDLLEVVLGDFEPSSIGRVVLPSQELRGDVVAIGYGDRPPSTAPRPPPVIVLDDSRFAEAFAWIRAYAAEGSPLSQFTRVVLASDWDSFGALQHRSEVSPHREDQWASVVLGETLSQGDSEMDLESLPLSRSTGTFSMPVARASLVFGAAEATRKCVDRLRMIEGDRRFTRKAVSTNHLLPIWSMCAVEFGDVSPTEAAMLVMEAAFNHLSGEGAQPTTFTKELTFDAFYSDSVESRVVAFNHLSTQMLKAPRAPSGGGLPAAVLATAAFLVGRSTSHYFLLKRVAKEFPAAFSWFGLIASKAGLRAWEGNWLRAVKGIERLLRPRFDWLEPPVADLSWAEFSWFASTFEGSDVFTTLPKMLPKTLGVEVVPGAPFQFRLSAANGGESDTRSNLETQADTNDVLLEVIKDVVALVRRLESRVKPLESAPQKTLPFGGVAPQGAQPVWKGSQKPRKPRRLE